MKIQVAAHARRDRGRRRWRRCDWSATSHWRRRSRQRSGQRDDATATHNTMTVTLGSRSPPPSGSAWSIILNHEGDYSSMGIRPTDPETFTRDPVIRDAPGGRSGYLAAGYRVHACVCGSGSGRADPPVTGGSLSRSSTNSGAGGLDAAPAGAAESAHGRPRTTSVTVNWDAPYPGANAFVPSVLALPHRHGSGASTPSRRL